MNYFVILELSNQQHMCHGHDSTTVISSTLPQHDFEITLRKRHNIFQKTVTKNNDAYPFS